MNLITNRISKALADTTDDMPVYVCDNKPLARDIAQGWPKRSVTVVGPYVQSMDHPGLLIMDKDSFVIRFPS